MTTMIAATMAASGEVADCGDTERTAQLIDIRNEKLRRDDEMLDSAGISGDDVDADDADDDHAANTDDADDSDAAVDAAPVSQKNYRSHSWWAGHCVGFVVNNAGITAARLKWPKGQNRRGIFARIKKTQNSEKRRSMRRQKNKGAMPRTIG